MFLNKYFLYFQYFYLQVPLGLIFKSEQKTSEMAEIIKEIHEKYIPISSDIHGVIDILSRVPFGGDQLTEERIVNTQKAFLGGDTQFKRLQGVDAKFEDWHLKKTLYEV